MPYGRPSAREVIRPIARPVSRAVGHTRKHGVSTAALAILFVGGTVAYAGVKGIGISDAFRSLLSGQNPSKNPQTMPINPNLAVAGKGADTTAGGSRGPGGAIPSPPAGSKDQYGTEYGTAYNRSVGAVLASQYGWQPGTANWTALDAIWNAESRWENTAYHPPSACGEAFGIPQACDYRKMPKAAWPKTTGGSASPVAQINWGLKYIKEGYGDPVHAKQVRDTRGWY